MREPYSPDLPTITTFPVLSSLRSEWHVSPDLFGSFLAWLDPNREEAGKKYEDIRRRLIKMFSSRGCFCPEDLADETINRVIVKVPDIKDCYRGDPGRYCGGVARNVLHEYARKRTVPVSRPKADPPEARERELECLDRCLNEVAVAQRSIILRYYEGEKGTRIQIRSGMARELGTEPNALRLRIHRIRTVLQKCVGDCLAESAG